MLILYVYDKFDATPHLLKSSGARERAPQAAAPGHDSGHPAAAAAPWPRQRPPGRASGLLEAAVPALKLKNWRNKAISTILCSFISSLLLNCKILKSFTQELLQWLLQLLPGRYSSFMANAVVVR